MEHENEHKEVSRRSLVLGGLAAGVGIVVAGCGSSSKSAAQTATTTATTGGATTATTAPATTVATTATASTLAKPTKKPAKLVMRAWGDPYSTALGKFPAATFTAKTGIPVEFDLTDFPEIQTKVEQAVKAGQRPPVDLVYTVAPHCFAASLRKYAVALDPSLVTNFADLSSAGKPDDGTMNWANIYTYTLPVVYRKDKVQFSGPISWNDLFDPKYKGMFTFNLDPNLMVWPIAKMLGLDPAKDDMKPVFEKIKTFKPQMAAIIENDTQLIDLMNNGQATMALAIVGDAPVIKNGAWIVPKEGVSLSADGLYIPKGLPDEVTYYAQLLVNEIIDPANETSYCEAIFAVPSNSKATPVASMKGDPAFPFTDAEIKLYAIPISNEVSTRNQDAWVEAFTTALQK
jgi:putative spermidine/putrescine transport system substrate-binding protein